MIDQVLRVAWGSSPPWIDLYVRAGCKGADEMKYLLASVELFWPRFLGDIIVVLDPGDERYLEQIIPAAYRTHSYRVVYEHCPCMPGRVFNQYSYITLDRYSQAQFVVTLDSDCAFHTPVTPDVLFNERGELKLAVSREFQRGAWSHMQQVVTGINADYGHSMVTQPVAFITSTLGSFRNWIQKTRGRCYEDIVVDAILDGGWQSFCWMCQLNVYISHTNVSGYDVHYVEERSDVYVRYGIHTAAEGNGKGIVGATPEIVSSGLCLWFGEEVFPSCRGMDLTYINRVLWSYANSPITPKVSDETRIASITQRRQRLSDALEHVRPNNPHKPNATNA
jgi:hypothetical protein